MQRNRNWATRVAFASLGELGEGNGFLVATRFASHHQMHARIAVGEVADGRQVTHLQPPAVPVHGIAPRRHHRAAGARRVSFLARDQTGWTEGFRTVTMRDLLGSRLAWVSGGCASTTMARFVAVVTMCCGIAGETFRLRARFGR